MAGIPLTLVPEQAREAFGTCLGGISGRDDK
jgi:hypothetical protein